tara:strand:- start:84 stop:809 length:726 start_codon:yes stop_codon:yes gene_type:complete
MKIIEKRQFDYIQDKIFKNLSKRDKDNLRKYRNTYRWYKDNNNKLKALEDEINKRKKKKYKYIKDLTKRNKELDHLKKYYQFTWSISKLKKKGGYYNFTISRRQYHTKTGSLGSAKNIKSQLLNCLFYKHDESKINQIKKDWKLFLNKEMNDYKSKASLLLLDLIMKDVTLKRVSLNRTSLFPLSRKDYPALNENDFSIPSTITNKMRWELKHLGYSKDDVKCMTPKECWELINQNIPKHL